MLHSARVEPPRKTLFTRLAGGNITCHGVIYPNGLVYKCLPWDIRGRHCGGLPWHSVNAAYLGFEMIEPATIAYVRNMFWKDTDPEITKAHILSTYKTAVELFATLCFVMKLDPLWDGAIISHYEGYRRSAASYSDDVERIWQLFGLSMNQFRRDVLIEYNKKIQHG
jgi:hypothetical protein